MSASVVVIGAGPGGLAAAILLASAGLRVKVIERLSVVGGRTSAISAGGFKFDLGPTFFLFPRVLEEIFAAAGTSLRSEVEMVRLDPQYRIVFGEGGELDATAEVSQMEAQIAQLSLEDAGGFRRFLDENRVKLRRMQPCLESPFLGWRDIFNVRLLKMLPMLRPHQSIDTYLKRFFRDPRIRLAFSFQSKYLGMSPFRCPSRMGCSTRSEVARRSPRQWRGWRSVLASRSGSMNRSRKLFYAGGVLSACARLRVCSWQARLC